MAPPRMLLPYLSAGKQTSGGGIKKHIKQGGDRMAVDTDNRLQNQVIYSVYVRNHTPEGTFLSVIPDLDRIKAEVRQYALPLIF